MAKVVNDIECYEWPKKLKANEALFWSKRKLNSTMSLTLRIAHDEYAVYDEKAYEASSQYFVDYKRESCQHMESSSKNKM